jgi:C_GCAxxG_C_C family probable redox protein
MSHDESSSLAESYFKANYNCSQSTLCGVLNGRGKGYRSKIKLACGFGAGIAQTGRTCGCISGVIMAIGDSVPDKGLSLTEWKQKVADISSEFISRFNTQFGAVECSELTKCDMADPIVRKGFLVEEDGRSRICLPMVGKATKIALVLLDERIKTRSHSR